MVECCRTPHHTAWGTPHTCGTLVGAQPIVNALEGHHHVVGTFGRSPWGWNADSIASGSGVVAITLLDLPCKQHYASILKEEK